MEKFSDKIIKFNRSLDLTVKMPEGTEIMNPFREEQIMKVTEAFYRKYYNDTCPRHLILGINPGRFGAGVTGIPFTDTKRLKNECGLGYQGKETHEPSSVFVYEVIKEYGGPERFYGDFFIGAVCPLGFTITDAGGRKKNYNYYDSAELKDAVSGFIADKMKDLTALGFERDVCFCFGTGKNESFLRSLNEEYGFFNRIIALEHPRFIMQYRAKSKGEYIRKYLEAFSEKGRNSDIL